MSDPASDLSERELRELCALADGTLAAAERAAVEARVAASPALQALVERQRHAVAATRALADEPAPESLRTQFEERRRATAVRSRLRSLVPRPALVGAVAVTVAVVAVLAVVLTGGPGAPSVAEAARLASGPPTAPAPPPLAEGGTKLALDVEGVVFPDLLRYGWQAVGVRRDELDGRNATTVFYEKDESRIAYVIVGGSGLPRPSGAPGTRRDDVLYQTLRMDGRLAVTWRRLGHTCILIGPAPREELLALASWRGNGTLRY